ncbi:MAG TPA: cytochrome c [Verrucomicrobiae bacterium]|nr:cytochrome c [Verrucomicrobiae bacterium]
MTKTILILSAACACAWSGCRQDMFDQPKSSALGPSDFFADRAASRPIPPHTVARNDLEADHAFYTGMIGTNLVTTFPFPITRNTLRRGRERYEIDCVPCHGETGDGNGIVVGRGFPAPPSYNIQRLREAPVGHFFDVMTRGYGVMYSYAARVTPADRWAIAAYIRALQLSQHATLPDVPTNELTTLEASQSTFDVRCSMFDVRRSGLSLSTCTNREATP